MALSSKNIFKDITDTGQKKLSGKRKIYIDLVCQICLRLKFKTRTPSDPMSSPLRNPDYLKAAASIRDQFTGKSPGIALPSERRLAEQLGLGRSIINRAVLHLITEGVLRREGYKLYTTAREETSTDTPQRIVILKNDLFIRQFRTSDNIWIEYRPVNPENPAQAVREVAGNLPLPEGLIVAPGHVESLSFTEAVLEINRAGVEVVSLFRRIPGISAVLLSANQAMTTLLDHLNALGHRELACVAGQAADPWDHELSEAYVLTCRNLGFSQSAGRVYPLFPARLMPAKRLLKETLTSRPRPTALVCTDDFHAAAMMRACHQLKVRVPEDISITGFGDRPEIIGSDPPLTTLRTDEALLRDLAIQVVRNRLRSRKTGSKPAPCRVALA